MAGRKGEAAAGGCFILVAVFALVVKLAIIGVLVWAVIALVNHFTA